MSSKRTERKPEPGGSRPARLRILDKEVQISCNSGEEDDLLQAAAYIDRSMRDLRRRNTTSSIEKIAIVVAINTANALLKSRALESSSQQSPPELDGDISDRLSILNSKLDDILEENVVDSTNSSE